MAKCPKTFRPSAIIVDKCAVSRAGLGAMLARNGYKISMICADLDDLKPGQLAKNLADPNPTPVLIGLDEVSEHTLSRIQVLIDQGFRVVILGQRLSSAAVYEVLRLGTYGYLLKDEIEPALLASALTLVRFGSVVIAQGLTGIGLGLPASRTLDNKGVLAQDIPLSKGDLTILELLTQGASNKMIARKLDIAEATVKVRMMFLLRKLHVSNRTQAAIWATQHLARTNEAAAQQFQRLYVTIPPFTR
jgi:two-component system nitrate/nitrite response regulator NarL